MPCLIETTANHSCTEEEGQSFEGGLPVKSLNQKGFWRMFALFSSKTFWALLLFVGVCQTMAALKVAAIGPQQVPYPTWTSQAIDDYLSKKKQPDLVFLGSSLMLVPLDGVDADYTGKAIDGSQHHQSLFFESKFKSYSGERINTFNFALPGEMPSDAFLITKFLLLEEKRPDVIVYGVGPRDFMDNLLPSPSATDPFRYLSRFGDYSDRIDLIAPDWQERLSYELGRLFYPLAESMSISTKLQRDGERFLASALPQIETADIHKRRLLLPQYHSFEIQAGECWFRPTDEKTRPGFANNIDEYAKRYKQLKWRTFSSQMQFLDDILTISQDRGIHVVLVAMPITDINRKLIPDEGWRAYKTNLERLAGTKGASFIDMYETKAFPLSDFQDTVHLHSGGGKRFLDLLARKLANDHKVISAINMDRADEDKQAIAGVRKESQL